MGQKTGNFYRIKNKKENKKYLIGWSYIVNLVWGQKTESWFGIWRLADWIYCVSGQVEHLQGHKSYLRFDLLTLHPGQEQIHLRLRNSF